MPDKLTTLIGALASAVLLIAGCTTQAWYEGMKQGAENDCNKQPPGAREQCLARLNKKTYDEYERERIRY